MAQIIKLMKRMISKLLFIYNQILLVLKIKYSKCNKVFLFGSPGHSNMGDQAQTYCIQRWIETNYPDYQVLIFTLPMATDFIIKIIVKNLKPDDKIYCHSGYHLTDLYNEKKVYCKMTALCPNHKIVIFPQTINFINDKKDEEFVANTFNNHGNVTLLCRDEFSYQTAQSIFNKCKLYLYPDIVTSLIGILNYSNHNKEGVLFCMRNDVESFYSKEQKNEFINKFKDFKTCLTDTTISTSYHIIKHRRAKILNKIWDTYSKYKVIITDRYHGTIFSLIANTPVIVIASTDHKLSSGVKWFPESFRDYVFYAENLDGAYDKALEILNRKEVLEKLPPYFAENYYSKLKTLLENETL